MKLIDKNNPSPAWIASLRQRYPCEREIDRVLTRKLERRAGPPYVPLSLATLSAGLESLLRNELRGDFSIHHARWLSGGASKLQVAFELEWHQPAAGRTRTPMVIRMEPSESIVESSRLREFQIIKAVGAILPVPAAYWLDAEGKYFPYPAIVYGYAEGVTKPSGMTSNVSGLGINFGPALRPVLAAQFVQHLATLHTWDWQRADLSALDVPVAGTAQAMAWNLAWWERVWEEDGNREIPLLRLAAGWLRDNLPVAERISLLHGDYRSGNFLYTEHDQRITAWLDWELGRLGDYHEDVAYVTLPYLAHRAEDGVTHIASGMMETEAFYRAYEEASGLTLNRATLHYYQLFHAYRAAVIVLGSGYRAALNGKTHQDLLLNWIMGLGYTNLELIRKMLVEIA